MIKYDMLGSVIISSWQLDDWVSVGSGGHRVQTGSGAQLPSYSVGTGDYFFGGKADGA
jgi:hypothetical protein